MNAVLPATASPFPVESRCYPSWEVRVPSWPLPFLRPHAGRREPGPLSASSAISPHLERTQLPTETGASFSRTLFCTCSPARCWVSAPVLVPAAVTKHHRRAGRNNRQGLTRAAGGWKSMVKVQAKLVSGESTLRGLQTAAFSLRLSPCVQKKKHWCPPLSSEGHQSYGTRTPPLWCHLHKGSFSKYSHIIWGPGFNM